MSCCGKKRSNGGASAPVASSAVGQVRLGITVRADLRGPEFEYLGGNVLTVTGQGTGMQYRFVGHGARSRIDPRDRGSLARVPQLREVMR